MVFQRIISRLSGRTRIFGQPQKSHPLNGHSLVKFSDRSSKPLSQITQKCDLLSDVGNPRFGENCMWVIDSSAMGIACFGAFDSCKARSGKTPDGSSVNYRARFLGMDFSFPSSLKFASCIHSVGPNEFEKGIDDGPVETQKNSGFFEGSSRRPGGIFDGLTQRLTNTETGYSRDTRPLWRNIESGGNNRSMNVVKGMMNDNNRSDNRFGVESNADIVHVKILRNNTFVTVTDSKGNKKMGASAGSLAEMKGGPKVSKYAAEATAEHVGRVAKSMGLKSVVMKVNGFTHFKRKKLAILSFRDGYTNSRSDQNPVVHIEDTTRKPHNGCRLRKQRRV